MRRGHIRVSKGFPAGPQVKALSDANVTTQYQNDIAAAIRSLRKGDKLYVHTFQGLGTSRKGIEKAVDDIHAKGACAVDAATGWRSDGPNGYKLLSQAVAGLMRERQEGKAKANGRAGGVASGKAKRKGWMPWATIEKFWFNKTLGRDELMERINGAGYKEISYFTIHKKLGKRGVQLGRTPNKS